MDPRAGRRLHLREGPLPGKLIDDLVQAAEVRLRLGDRVGDATLEAHLRQWAKSKGQEPEDVAGYTAPFPEVLVYLWEAFVDISRTRKVSEVGPQPISFPDLLSWAILNRVEWLPWEVEVLRRLDDAALKHFLEKQKKDARSRASPPVDLQR